jgi:hypothetical protein
MDWIYVAQVRGKQKALVNTVMNLRVLQNAGKFLSSCTTGVLSRRAQLHAVSHVTRWIHQLSTVLQELQM